MTEKKQKSPLTPAADRLPLSEVVFTHPTEIEGFDTFQRRLISGVPFPLHPEKEVRFSFDPRLRVVVVGRDLVPVEHVSQMRRQH